ncbi:Fanconi anemia core complex-associated protein 20 [Sorex fumeus]|uniref:Fanconi anemia core complex-associated protein 20 n=1 Tax=Sorex fumeus TaxID=62283 RepID=UPI0024AD415C|nr:Fanconi anemia core complex-associated protein 20 [Sorex fumeus]
MEPARRPRLSLSRRRPPEPEPEPEAEPEPRAPPAGPWTPREHERPWSALLRVASAELGADGACPPLPARPGRESRAAPSSLRPPQERARAPEVFSVGRETFTWLPLPPRGSAELPPATPGPAGHAPAALRLRTRRLHAADSKAPERPPVAEHGAGPGVRFHLLGGGPLPKELSKELGEARGLRLTQLDVDGHLAQCLAGGTTAEM